MICIRCAELSPETRSHCARCGSLLRPQTFDNIQPVLQRYADETVRLRIAAWKKAGLIDEATEARLSSSVPAHEAPAAPVPVPAAPVPVTPAEVVPVSSGGAEQAAAVAENLFQADSASVGAAVGGIAALAALDAIAPPRPPPAPHEPSYFQKEVWPVLYENVGWFIGALFVLAGSVYGVREAWEALDEGARHALVAGALFAYHAGFAGLAALLAKRAAGASRVLGAIAIGLLPMTFAAQGGLWEHSLGGGLLLTLVIAGCAAFTVGTIGKRFEFRSGELLSVLLPSLLAQIAATASVPFAAVLPFAGTAAIVWSLRRESGNRREWLAAFAVYGALALEITCAAMDSDGIAPGSVGWAGLALRVVLLGATGAAVFTRESWRKQWPHFVPTLEIASLGLVATAAIVATATSGAVGVALQGASTAIAAVTFFFASKRHPRAIHLAMLAGAAASWRLGAVVSSEPLWAAAQLAFYASVCLQVARWPESKSRRAVLGWSVVFALIGLGGVLASANDSRTGTISIISAVVAFAAFRAGGFVVRGLHYLGSLAAILAVVALYHPDGDASFVLGVGLSVAFAAAGFAFDVLAVRAGSSVVIEALRPFDDVSLLLICVAIPQTLKPEVATTLRAAIVGGAFLLRAWRDQSRLISAAGALLFAWRACVLLGPSVEHAAYVALGCLAIASLRGLSDVPDRSGRRLFGVLRLPFAAPLRVLWADGFAIACFVVCVTIVAPDFAWILQPDEAQRWPFVQAVAIVVAVAAGAFLTPAFHSIRARGHVLTLATVAALIGLAGGISRVGRPMPMRDTAEHVTAIATAVWIAAMALRKWGPGLGRSLGNERSGREYHWVPHIAVGVLVSILSIDSLAHAFAADAELVTLGAAWAAALLARSTRRAEAYNLVVPLLLIAAAQTGVIFDVSTTLTGAPGLVAQGMTGVAWCCLAIVAVALFVSRLLLTGRGIAWLLLDQNTDAIRMKLADTLGTWPLFFVMGALLSATMEPLLLPAVIALGISAIIAAAGRRSAVGDVVLCGVAVVSALAQRQPYVPVWAGPAITSTGVALILIVPLMKRRGYWKTGAISSAYGLATLACSIGILYALADGGATSATSAGLVLLSDAARKIVSQWYSSQALAPSLLLLSIAAASLALQHRAAGAKSRVPPLAAFTVLFASLAVLLGLPELVDFAQHALPDVVPRLTITEFAVRFGWELAPAAAVLSILAHGQNLARADREEPQLAQGLRFGRDVLVIAVAVLVNVSVVYPTYQDHPLGSSAALLSCLALVATALMSAHAAARERTSFHVYAVQLGAVGVYGLIRLQWLPNWPPEADSIFVLALGFVLLGVTVMARRAGIPPVAAATRRFAALLPFALAWVMPFHASTSAALMAAGAGALWSALGWVESNRIFGSLGAAAVNLALFTAALTTGFDGPEVYVAPFGLMTLALGQIFAGSLTPGVRQSVRILGSLLVYAPAAAQLSLHVGGEGSGEYALGFGAVCLLGVGAGMVLHIRAYLALGTGFLVLDVLANVMHAGLRDHRIGFVVLSLAGLGILGGMVFVTLQRELVQRMTMVWRARLAGWE